MSDVVIRIRRFDYNHAIVLGNVAPLETAKVRMMTHKLRDLGAIYVAAPNWTSHYEVDGNLITGQNPQSTLAVTQAVIAQLG